MVTNGYAFTAEEDAEIRRLRASGMIWSEIGRQLHRDGACCRLRIMRVLREPDPLQSKAQRQPRAPVKPTATMREGFGNDPLPAGSALSWSAITTARRYRALPTDN